MATRLVSVSAALVTALLAGGLLAGCGGSDKPAGKAASHGSSTTPSASATSGASAGAGSSSAGPGAPGASGASGGASAPSDSSGRQDGRPALTAGPGEITVTGDVEDGVEPGCLVLRGPTETYVLVGGDRDQLAAGGRMTVRGKAEVGLMTTCMQGTPLRVLEIAPR